MTETYRIKRSTVIANRTKYRQLLCNNAWIFTYDPRDLMIFQNHHGYRVIAAPVFSTRKWLRKNCARTGYATTVTNVFSVFFFNEDDAFKFKMFTNEHWTMEKV
jgi:hypothetical protein